MTWVPSGLVQALLEWWQSWKYKKAKKVLWEVIPFAVLWSVWGLRNKCVFEHAQPD
ncbi:hypothetical protein ACSBR1_039952 [Camellia fascicularis]